MKIKLVFETWLGPALENVYATEEGVRLSSRDFHSGTTFQGTIELDGDSESELIQALGDGYSPVFYVKGNE